MAFGNAQGLALAEGRKKIKDRTPVIKGGVKEEKSTEEKADTEVTQGEAGASKTYPLPAGQLKKGSFIVMKKIYPCKVESLSTSKTGKHGHAKINISAKGMFISSLMDIFQIINIVRRYNPYYLKLLFSI